MCYFIYGSVIFCLYIKYCLKYFFFTVSFYGDFTFGCMVELAIHYVGNMYTVLLLWNYRMLAVFYVSGKNNRDLFKYAGSLIATNDANRTLG